MQRFQDAGFRSSKAVTKGEDRLARFREPRLRRRIHVPGGAALGGRIVQDLQSLTQTRGVQESAWLTPNGCAAAPLLGDEYVSSSNYVRAGRKMRAVGGLCWSC